MSVAASLPEVRRRNPALRILSYSVCLLLVVSIASLWWLFGIARSPLPQVDGSVSVHGVSAKVRVVRDEHGVPTIEAATLDDLFFAQGYVTAQDRLWQMDMMRRSAAGELSEIIGEDTGTAGSSHWWPTARSPASLCCSRPQTISGTFRPYRK